jgi:hypothetical protein
VDAQGFWHFEKLLVAYKDSFTRVPESEKLLLYLLKAKMAYAAQRHEFFFYAISSACTTIASMKYANKETWASRINGVLIAMEALCLDALLKTTLLSLKDVPIMSPMENKSRQLYYDWQTRASAHARSLSKQAGVKFESFLEKETLAGKFETRSIVSRPKDYADEGFKK